jgi:ADP-ribose pyrophosphatase
MPVPPPPNATRVFQGVVHDVWQWEQDLFDGSRATFECSTRQDGVSVIAFLDPQTILLTHEEHSGRARFQDVPGGRVERGETAEVAAARECLEETGYRIGRLQVFRQLPLHGSIRLVKTVCLATDLVPDADGPRPDAGERIRVQPTAWQEAVRFSLQHELRSQDAMLAILAMEFDPETRALKDRFLSP